MSSTLAPPVDAVGDAGVATDLAAVGAFLDTFLDERIARAGRHGDDYRRLWQAARDAATGGKRIRPALVLGAHDAWGAPRPDDAVRVAAAFELLHTAFLMHDDVIDRDLVRRGAPTVAGRFANDAVARGIPEPRAHDYGDASAILAGDLLISAAHGLVASVDAPHATRLALLELVDECVFRTAAGEHDDVRFAAGVQAAEADILAMVENKTAAYSFSAPLQAGALLAGAPAASLARLARIGRHLGIAFQLRDDLLGVFGDERVTGKSASGDLREGKQTLLIASARGHATWETVAGRFGDPWLDDEDAAALRAALVACGAAARVERIIDEHCAHARAEFEGGETDGTGRADRADGTDASGPLPAPLRTALARTIRSCSERRR